LVNVQTETFGNFTPKTVPVTNQWEPHIPPWTYSPGKFSLWTFPRPFLPTQNTYPCSHGEDVLGEDVHGENVLHPNQQCTAA